MILQQILYLFLKINCWLTGKKYDESELESLQTFILNLYGMLRKNFLLFLISPLLLSLITIYIAGSFHHDKIDSDFKLEPLENYPVLRNTIMENMKEAIETGNYKDLERKIQPYKHKIGIMIFGNGKLHIDSHAEFEVILYKERLDYFEVTRDFYIYEASIYSLKRKEWFSRYKHWLKYFTRSLKPTSRYHYLTVWLCYIYPISLLLCTAFYLKIKKINTLYEKEKLD